MNRTPPPGAVETNGRGSRGGRADLFCRGPVIAPGRNTGCEPRSSCLDRLHSLTQEEWATLAGFARGRLLRVGLDPSQADDMVQDAVLAVLTGLESAGQGRHPRAADLAGAEAFRDYLRGVIASLVESARRNGWHGRFWETWDETSAPGPSPPAGDFAQLEFRDLRRQFFAALARRAPPRLQGLVGAWRQRGEDCDQIPLLGGHRQWRADLRKVAAQVFKRLMEPSPVLPKRKADHEPAR